MKSIFLTCLLSASSFSFAATYKLNNPVILGEYQLKKADKKSEVQKAELRYNVQNQLVVILDRNEQEFEISGPDKNGVIFEGTDEPNCDGDEPACYFDAETKITLTSTKVNGDEVPQLVVEITVANAWKEDEAGEKTTYVLNWVKELPNAIPFYTEAKNPRELDKVLTACKKVVEPTVGHGGVGNEADICGLGIETYHYRGSVGQTLSYFKKERIVTKKRLIRLNEETLNTRVFAGAEAKIKALNPNELKVGRKALIAESRKLKNYILKTSDIIYYYQFSNTAVLVTFNTGEQTITEYMIRNKK